jgi:LAS superfamily LD-carboxypeptidase LdcB
MIFKLNMFSRHELVKTQNGYTLVLYVEKQTSEFGEEFFSSLSSKSKKLQSDSIDYVKKYINENYRDIKIDTVKIMLGSVLIASIGYSSLNAGVVSAEPTISQTQLQANIVYTVKSGDTLYKIAQSTGTSVELLMKLNNLRSSTIFPGQQLKTREVEDSYTVKAGDTLYSISRNFNISILKLKEINNLTGDTIYPGQKLNLTAVSTPVPPATGNLVLVNKIYTLPANYIPSSLVNPNVSSADMSKTKMTPEAAKALEALFLKAKLDNINLTAISGYRSYTRQNEIFASNIIKYGSATAANQFSARPGQSEHQTGLAMDISSPSVNFTLTQSYAQTREGKWLKENAPQFGFIVRYPEGKESITGYQFEPWHLRYLGKSAALEITGRNITLEEYLGKV